jgi:hypothetical protein
MHDKNGAKVRWELKIGRRSEYFSTSQLLSHSRLNTAILLQTGNAKDFAGYRRAFFPLMRPVSQAVWLDKVLELLTKVEIVHDTPLRTRRTRARLKSEISHS